MITVTAPEFYVCVVLLAYTLVSSGFSTFSYIREHLRQIWRWWHWIEVSFYGFHLLLALLALIFTFLFLNSSDVKFRIASFVVLLMVAVDLFLDTQIICMFAGNSKTGKIWRQPYTYRHILLLLIVLYAIVTIFVRIDIMKILVYIFLYAITTYSLIASVITWACRPKRPENLFEDVPVTTDIQLETQPKIPLETKFLRWLPVFYIVRFWVQGIVVSICFGLLNDERNSRYLPTTICAFLGCHLLSGKISTIQSIRSAFQFLFRSIQFRPRSPTTLGPINVLQMSGDQPTLDMHNTLVDATDSEASTQLSESVDSDMDEDATGSQGSITIPDDAEYIYEHDRRYHWYGEDRYPFPNDNQEQMREILLHTVISHRINLHFAPVATAQDVLDLGTGTGQWAIEFGERYPAAWVLGIDISPIMQLDIPRNVHFRLDDASLEWTEMFDYIHTRNFAYGCRDWRGVLQKAFKHLKPGGWMECQEPNHFPQNMSIASFNRGALLFWERLSAGLEFMGIDLQSTKKLPELMQDIGFVNVKAIPVEIPLGHWYEAIYLQEGMIQRPLGELGWNREAIQNLCKEVLETHRQGTPQEYFRFLVVYGQKPEKHS